LFGVDAFGFDVCRIHALHGFHADDCDPDFHNQGKLLEMLKPYPADEMEAYPVCTTVNNPRNETAACVEAMT
jgi:hypothetical protein